MKERSHPSPNRTRLLGQLDRLIAGGKITTEGAQRLRAASETDFEQALHEIRVRHIRADIDAAIARGDLEANDANALMDDIQRNPDAALLGELRRKLRRGPSSSWKKTS